jgi:hypothetical protein
MASRSKKACGRPSSTERTWRERGGAYRSFWRNRAVSAAVLAGP